MKVTTQLTSKPLKAAGALCNVVMFLSLLFIFFGEPSMIAFQSLALAFMGKVAVRVLTWWHHD